MKKRLLCLVLGLVMMLPLVLSGCADEEEVVTYEDVRTMTLYGIKEEGTTDEAIAVVEAAINEITESKFHTHIELHYFLESEYYEVIEKVLFAAKEEADRKKEEADRKKEEAASRRKAGIKEEVTTIPDELTETETAPYETYIDKKGAIHIIYPEAKEDQIDIFLVNSYDKLNRYTQDEMILNLSESLGSSYKAIYKFTNPAFFSGCTITDAKNTSGLRALPNNHVLGETTYLLINKEVATGRLYYGEGDFTSATLPGINEYLKAVATYCDDIKPLYNVPGLSYSTVGGLNTLIGGFITSDITSDSRMLPRNLLSLSTYTNYLSFRYNYLKNGYLTEGDITVLPENMKEYGAIYIKATDEEVRKYEDDFYILTANGPIAQQQDLVAGAYCVSAFSEYKPTYALDILTMLTTDADFVNLMTYGVKGVNYTIDEETGYVVPTEKEDMKYIMNPMYTGNQFLMMQNATWSDELLALSADNWANAKIQNRNVFVSPYVPFVLQYYTAEDFEDAEEPYVGMYTQEMVDKIIELSAVYKDKVMNFEPYVDENGEEVTYEAYIKAVAKEFEAEEAVKQALDTNNEYSIYSQYLKWYTDLHPAA